MNPPQPGDSTNGEDVTRADQCSAATLPSSPLVVRLVSWAITTGDDVSTMARGFDLPEQLVGFLLAAKSTRLDVENAALICRRLRLDPIEVWFGEELAESDQAGIWQADPFHGERVPSEAWPLVGAVGGLGCPRGRFD